MDKERGWALIRCSSTYEAQCSAAARAPANKALRIQDYSGAWPCLLNAVSRELSKSFGNRNLQHSLEDDDMATTRGQVQRHEPRLGMSKSTVQTMSKAPPPSR